MIKNYVRAIKTGVSAFFKGIRNNLMFITGSIMVVSPFVSVLAADAFGAKYSLVLPSILLGIVLVLNNIYDTINSRRMATIGDRITFEDSEGNPSIRSEDIYEAIEKLHSLEVMIERGELVEK